MIFNDKKITKSNFYENKNIFTMKDVDVYKILVSKKEPDGIKGAFKYFIAYNGNDKIRQLCIELRHIIRCVRHFKDGDRTMPYKVTDKKFLKRYIKIWREISSLIETEFAKEPVFGNNDGEFITSKIKSYGDKINADFYNENEERKVPKKKT